MNLCVEVEMQPILCVEGILIPLYAGPVFHCRLELQRSVTVCLTANSTMSQIVRFYARKLWWRTHIN
jgi:hypothetical protein